MDAVWTVKLEISDDQHIKTYCQVEKSGLSMMARASMCGQFDAPASPRRQ